MNQPLQWIATMPGPSFLGFYLVVVATALLMCRLIVGRLDRTETERLPSILAEPDPLGLAYLRGGSRELTRLLTLELLERGNLGVVDNENRELQQIRKLGARASLTALHRHVFQWFAGGRKIRDALANGGLHSEVERLTGQYRQWLAGDQLLVPRSAHRRARAIAVVALVVLGTLAAYKLSLALPAQRPVTLLLLGTLATIFRMVQVCRLPRLSRRGQAYLERLQFAYEDVQLPADRPPLGEVDPLLLLLVGLFGIGSLSETAYDRYTEMFPQIASSSWTFGDGGAGCGSCGGGGCSGSGCGGCSGCSS